MKQPIHILTQMGILSSFSVSKKITEAEVKSMMKGGKKQGKSEEELIELAKAKIMKDIIEATQKGTLPGLIIETQEIPIKSLELLNHLVKVISNKLKNKKLDKLSLCYFINYLVGVLNLTEDDFEEFHRKMKNSSDDEDDEDDEDKIS